MSRATIFVLGCSVLVCVVLLQTASAQGRFHGVKSADQQCIEMGYSGGLCGGESASVCSALVCADEYRRASIINKPMDGTGCGNGKVCINGVCQTVDPSDASAQHSPQREGCRSRWGPQG